MRSSAVRSALCLPRRSAAPSCATRSRHPRTSAYAMPSLRWTSSDGRRRGTQAAGQRRHRRRGPRSDDRVLSRARPRARGPGRVTGLGDQRVEIAMMRTPDGHARLELSRFLAPSLVADHRSAPVNALGYLRVMFAAHDIDDTLVRLRAHGAELVSSEVVQFGDSIRLCYIRGPEGLPIGLAEELG